jgi:hypothetical protein
MTKQTSRTMSDTRMVSSLRAELDKIRTAAGFWIDDDLYRKVLEAAGE